MAKDLSYQAVMERKAEIVKSAVGIDYNEFARGELGFDYEGMMSKVAYGMEQMLEIQRQTGVGNTPLLELHNLTALARRISPAGKGARIFIKDEASNPSGSFKARRASISTYHAQKQGYKGVIAATSGNYGAAVASQAAMRGLNCIIVQEVFDSKGVGQPEILEKGRACEAYGAEVVQLTVGPELFYYFLILLEETGYFNASLYTPFGIAGVETLGWELAQQVRTVTGRDADAVVVTHAGGGNVTGTARGLAKAGCTKTKVIAASVDLKGLHMASDRDFNKKSFTTGHTGFGLPFATWPDRADVPRNAARPLRYLDRYVTISQGEVFYMTEALANLEGLERGPAGNISLAAAFAIAQEMDQDQILVVQETEYTGAGKHPNAQLSFARKNGVKIVRGNPTDSLPGQSIVIPEHPAQIQVKEIDLNQAKRSYLKNAVVLLSKKSISMGDCSFLAEECSAELNWVKEELTKLGIALEGA